MVSRTVSVTAVTLMVLTVTASPSLAQFSGMGALQPGDSVRLQLPGALRVEASMREMRGDTLILIVPGLASEWLLSGYDLVSLERYTDRNSREGFRNGAVVGMFAGVFVGAAIGLVLHSTGVIYDEDRPNTQIVGNTLKWVGLGFAFGGIGGGFWGGAHPGRGWVALQLPGPAR